MAAWIVHTEIYSKADGNETVPILFKAWPYLYSMHLKFPKDILQLDLSRFPLLFDKDNKIIEERQASDASFWTEENPFPLNSLMEDSALLEVYENIYPVSLSKAGTGPEDSKKSGFIRIQTLDQIKQIVAAKNREPENVILVVSNYIRVHRSTKDPTESYDVPVCVVFVIRRSFSLTHGRFEIIVSLQ